MTQYKRGATRLKCCLNFSVCIYTNENLAEV